MTDRVDLQQLLYCVYNLFVSGPRDPLEPMLNPLQEAQSAFYNVEDSASHSAETIKAVAVYGIFDANVVRRLPSHHPPRTISLLDWEQTTEAISLLLRGLEESLELKDFSTWDDVEVCALPA